MLPAPRKGGLSLADVMQSCFLALSGSVNRLGLARVDTAVVVLVDGLGAEALQARSGHARTLAGAMSSRSVIESGFPTTTAVAIASLTTGLTPGEHGLVGYSVLDAANDRVVKQLSGWDERLDPLTWQAMPTIFETASLGGFDAVAIGKARYENSGFSRAVLRGARYVVASSIADRMAAAAAELRKPGGPRLIYVYVPELDQACHLHGWKSPEWTAALEATDAAARDLHRALGPRDGMLVTADHGVLDIPRGAHVLFDETPDLVAGIRHIAGEPRCLQLHFEPDLTTAQRDRIISGWRGAEGDRAWVVTRDEAVGAGWFGNVRQEVGQRIGDLLVAARKEIAYYPAGAEGRSMIGQHGSWSNAERRVPLLRFGAF